MKKAMIIIGVVLTLALSGCAGPRYSHFRPGWRN